MASGGPGGSHRAPEPARQPLWEAVLASPASASVPCRRPIVLDEDAEETEEEGGQLFPRDAAVRLVELVNASHLNGQLALVLRFLPEKLRYEVALHPGGEKKALKPENMEALPLLEEVTLLRNRLAGPGVAASVARPALLRLEALSVTSDVLVQTKVGKVVNLVSRTLAGFDDIAEIGRRLVCRWRDMYRQEHVAETGRTGAAVYSAAPATAASAAAAAGVPSPRSGTRASAQATPAASTTRGAARSGSAAPTPQREQKRARLARTPTAAAAVEEPRLGAAATEPAAAPAAVRVELVPVPPEAPSQAPSGPPSEGLRRPPPEVLPPAEAPQGGPRGRSGASAVLAEGAPAGAAGRPPARGGQQQRVQAQVLAPAQEAPSESPLSWMEQVDAFPESDPAPPPKDCPQELAHLEPAYVQVLMNNPKVLDFLSKHPSIMKNLTADNIKFLIRNVMKSCRNGRQTQDEATLQEAGSAAGRAVTITNLPVEATESDVVSLFAKAGLGPVEVSLARESRYRRSCGVAFAMLSSRQAVEEALSGTLRGAVVHGHRVRVEPAGGTTSSTPSRDQGRGRRIAWKDDDELWDVAIYDRWESVLDFRERVKNSSMVVRVHETAPPGSDAARFKEAATRERAEESRRVREALGVAA